jgi:hypothetical protein
MHLRRLLSLPFGASCCFFVAAFVALSLVYQVSFFPPALKSRPLEMGSASTHVLIDAPKSAILDQRYGTSDFKSLTDRGVLLGNVMVSQPVRAYIAKRAGVPAESIQASTPLTPDYPRPIAEAGNEKHTSDILKSPDQYRLSIQANPTVPILDVLAQAPSAEQAVELANASVDGLQDYLDDVAARQGIAEAQRVHLKQLGRARGGVINQGVGWQLVGVAFLITFALSAAAVLFLARVHRGWVAARPSAKLGDAEPAAS